MSRAVGNIVRKLTRKDSDKLNCLYGPSGIEYEKCLLTLLSDKINFYPLIDGVYKPLLGLDFDFILSQSRIHQLPQIKNISRNLHLPIISIEHGFLPPNTQINPEWTAHNLISIYSNVTARNSWGDFNARVISETLIQEETPLIEKVPLIVFEGSPDLNDSLISSLDLGGFIWKEFQSYKDLESATYYLQPTTNYVNFQKVLKCLQSGTIILAKDCPIIREFVIDGVTGIIFNNISELGRIRDYNPGVLRNRIIKSYDKFFSQQVFKETFLGKLTSINNFYRG